MLSHCSGGRDVTVSSWRLAHSHRNPKIECVLSTFFLILLAEASLFFHNHLKESPSKVLKYIQSHEENLSTVSPKCVCSGSPEDGSGYIFPRVVLFM